MSIIRMHAELNAEVQLYSLNTIHQSASIELSLSVHIRNKTQS